MHRIPLLGFVTMSVTGFMGCASLHSYQMGDIDGTGGELIGYDIKQTELGWDIEEASQIAKSISKAPGVQKTANTVSDVWAAITFGPKTGEVTFSDQYADETTKRLKTSCASGKITGLVSIRETNKYPVVSGEIARIAAYCVTPRTK